MVGSPPVLESFDLQHPTKNVEKHTSPYFYSNRPRRLARPCMPKVFLKDSFGSKADLKHPTKKAPFEALFSTPDKGWTSLVELCVITQNEGHSGSVYKGWLQPSPLRRKTDTSWYPPQQAELVEEVEAL